MAALTRTNLIAAIKREARCGDGTELDSLIGDILDDVVADVFSKERCYELRVMGAGTAMTIATPTITLPADFQHVDEVRFSTDGVNFSQVLPANDFVYNTITGVPKFWKLVGLTLYVFPYSAALATHKIFLDYFKTPTFAAAGDIFPVFRLQAAVKKECITRLLDWHRDIEMATRMETSAGTSLARGMAANLESRTVSPIDSREPNAAVPEDSK